MLIGKRIKELRNEKNMSQQELGDAVGVTKVSVCGYENGSRTPSLETFSIMADIFGINADYLLGREIPVIREETKEYLGSVSEDDLYLIQELKHYPTLYANMIGDTKRCVSLINKKMR